MVEGTANVRNICRNAFQKPPEEQRTGGGVCYAGEERTTVKPARYVVRSRSKTQKNQRR